MSSTLTQTSWRLFVLHDLHGDKNMALRWFGMGGGLRVAQIEVSAGVSPGSADGWLGMFVA